ncbi:MAG: nucleoside-diphosphate sugar epimerase/dehydratase [Elusimicrobiota bacterium]|nr:nucleoside-diphosphate sugar epimerase/dehydratase [Elusimicrobiota bacterium]
MPQRTPRFSWRRFSVVAADGFMVIATFIAAFFIRFEFELSSYEIEVLLRTFPVALVCFTVGLHRAGVYRGLYYYSSFPELLNIARGVGLSACVSGAAILFFRQGLFPRSVLLLHPILAFVGVAGVRFAIRWGKTRFNMPRAYTGLERNVLLVGAGELGESVLRQMLKTPAANYRVIGFLDDDAAKWGLRIHEYPVFGGRDALNEVLTRYQVDDIVIAIGAKRGEIVADLVSRMRDLERRPELKIAPSLGEMLTSPGREVKVRKVQPADLLNREVIRLDEVRISASLRGKRVLVTGAGGTIGAELVRQVLGYGPSEITVVESHATSLFYIEGAARELARGAKVTAELGDVRDRSLVDRVFAEHRPQVVLHAAAHKHVHQIEHNVSEGVLNNAIATGWVCAAALAHGAEAFLLVSTDKAVKPSSVMGATKRLAEMVVKSYEGRGTTRFMAVRFGNVLGSSGSVLTIFQEQLDRGGPLTVTDPEVRRYFMTASEAVGLILQAVSLAQGGEIFVLKMGEPVRIADMARNLILLSGLEPGKDIQIKFTGLKQGEKLHEELMEDPAGFRASEHADIFILRGENQPSPGLDEHLLELELTTRGKDASAVVRKLTELVPTFRPDAAHAPATFSRIASPEA